MANDLWKPSEEVKAQLKKTINTGDRNDYTIAITKKQEKKAKKIARIKEKKRLKQRSKSNYIPQLKGRITEKEFSHPLLKTKEYNQFYSSKEWKQLRYLALLNSDGRCCCCGASAKDGATMNVDHIKPRSRYPELELSLDNLQILCSWCNEGKGGWDETNWQHFKSI
jgi:5-methylcytosine-specific restriction endonuclease McrA